MRKILAITLLNFTQGIREKIFWQVIFFFVFMLAVTFFMGVLSAGETAQVLRSAGLSGIEISAILLVVSSLIFNVYRERDSRLTEFLLSHFSRPVYISGKLMGYLLIALLYTALAGAGWLLVLVLQKAFTLSALAGLCALYSKIAIITAAALVFSVLFSSHTLALFSTVFVYIASEVSHEAVKIMMLSKHTVMTYVIRGMYYVLPAMDKLDIKSQVTFGSSPDMSFFLLTGAYTVLYVIFLWSVATYIFVKKEI